MNIKAASNEKLLRVGSQKINFS